MGYIRKVTGQKGQVERQQAYLNQQEQAARDAEQRQQQALNESIRQAAVATQLQQERQAAQSAASDALNKPMADPTVQIAPAATDPTTTARKKKFQQQYNTGVNI